MPSEAGFKQDLCADIGGLSLRAAVRCDADEREAPAQLATWADSVSLRFDCLLDRQPDAMTLRRRTVEPVFGTLKHGMGSMHFLTRTLEHVSSEMNLHVLACNLKRVLQILGIAKAMRAMKLAGA